MTGAGRMTGAARPPVPASVRAATILGSLSCLGPLVILALMQAFTGDSGPETSLPPLPVTGLVGLAAAFPAAALLLRAGRSWLLLALLAAVTGVPALVAASTGTFGGSPLSLAIGVLPVATTALCVLPDTRSWVTGRQQGRRAAVHDPGRATPQPDDARRGGVAH